MLQTMIKDLWDFAFIENQIAWHDSWNGKVIYTPEDDMPEATFKALMQVNGEVRNALTSQMEVYLLNELPIEIGGYYSAYLKRPTKQIDGVGVKISGPGYASTWPGDKIGTVNFGKSYSRYGKWGRYTITPVWVTINGMQFRGRWSETELDVCKFRRVK